MIDLKLMCIEIFKFEQKCVDKNIASKNICVESSESKINARNNIIVNSCFDDCIPSASKNNQLAWIKNQIHKLEFEKYQAEEY